MTNWQRLKGGNLNTQWRAAKQGTGENNKGRHRQLHTLSKKKQNVSKDRKWENVTQEQKKNFIIIKREREVLTQLFLSNKHFVSFHLQNGRVCLGPNTEAHGSKRPLVRRLPTFDPEMFFVGWSSIFIFCGWVTVRRSIYSNSSKCFCSSLHWAKHMREKKCLKWHPSVKVCFNKGSG